MYFLAAYFLLFSMVTPNVITVVTSDQITDTRSAEYVGSDRGGTVKSGTATSSATAKPGSTIQNSGQSTLVINSTRYSKDDLQMALSAKSIGYQSNPCHGLANRHYQHFDGFAFDKNQVILYKENGEIQYQSGYRSLADFVNQRRVCQDAGGADRVHMVSSYWRNLLNGQGPGH